MKKIKYIIIHHSDVSYNLNSDQFLGINRYHKQKFGMLSSLGYWVGYNYVINKKGRIRQARKDGEVTAAAYQKKMNTGIAIHICLDGNFDEQEPTGYQIRELKRLINSLRLKYGITQSNVMFHRDLASYKTCPGLWWTKERLKKLMSFRELKRDRHGGFWFCKLGDDGKQKVTSVGGLLTVLSREFGVETKSDDYFKKKKVKKYFN